MFKIIIFIFIFLSLSRIGAISKRKRSKFGNWSYFRKSYADIPIDVHLYKLPALLSEEEVDLTDNKDNGLIELFLPQPPNNYFVCFPRNFEEYEQVFLLSHVICRQLGFMTFVEVTEKLLPESYSPNDERYYSLSASSYRCSGLESSISHCKWNDINTDDCPQVTEISCGGCYSKIKATSGIILSPGYSIVDLYDVSCEWYIEVPEKHGINLSMEYFQSNEFSANLPCEISMPYLEIMYGIQSEVTVLRYCEASEFKNISIPFHTVKVTFFTGFNPRQDNRMKTKGVSITFEAYPLIEEELPLKLLLLSALGFIFIVCIVICRGINKFKLCICYIEDCFGKKITPIHRTHQFEDMHSTNLENVLSNRNECAPHTSTYETGTRVDDICEIGFQGKASNGCMLQEIENKSEKVDPNRLSVTPPVLTMKTIRPYKKVGFIV